MTSTSISEVRDAIGAQLRDQLARSINVDVDNEGKPAPVARLRLASSPVSYWGTFGASGLQTVRFELEVDPAGSDRSAVRRLDEYLSVGTGNGSSIVDALMSDTSLGGIAQTLTVDGLEYGGDGAVDESIVAVFTVEVILRKQGARA